MITLPDPTGVRRLVDAAYNIDFCYCGECIHKDQVPELRKAVAAVRVDELERVVEAARRIDASSTITEGTGWTEVRLDDYPNPAGNMFVVLRQALAALDERGTT